MCLEVSKSQTKFDIECGDFDSSDAESNIQKIRQHGLCIYICLLGNSPPNCVQLVLTGDLCSKTNSFHQSDKFLDVGCAPVRDSWDFKRLNAGDTSRS